MIFSALSFLEKAPHERRDDKEHRKGQKENHPYKKIPEPYQPRRGGIYIAPSVSWGLKEERIF